MADEINHWWGLVKGGSLYHLFVDPTPTEASLPTEAYTLCGICVNPVNWGDKQSYHVGGHGSRDCQRCVRLHNEALDRIENAKKANPVPERAAIRHLWTSAEGSVITHIAPYPGDGKTLCDHVLTRPTYGVGIPAGTKLKPDDKDCRLCVDRFNALSPAVQPPPKLEPEGVNHPPHYGGGDDPYEAIKVIEAWGLGFNLGNVLKYIRRAGRKPGIEAVADLAKAAWYLARELTNRGKA